MRTHMAAQVVARLLHEGAVAPSEEPDRFGLQFTLPCLVNLEDLARARAKRSVVEEDHVVLEEELAAHRARAGMLRDDDIRAEIRAG